MTQIQIRTLPKFLSVIRDQGGARGDSAVQGVQRALRRGRGMGEGGVSAAGDHPVLLYDGPCVFCDRTVKLVLRWDRAGTIRFTPLQGRFAEGLARRHPELARIDSLVLVEHAGDPARERVYVRSAGALRVAHHLGRAWRAAGMLGLVPGPLRDWAYDTFARHRYQIFGQFDACPIPSPAVRSRLID